MHNRNERRIQLLRKARAFLWGVGVVLCLAMVFTGIFFGRKLTQTSSGVSLLPEEGQLSSTPESAWDSAPAAGGEELLPGAGEPTPTTGGEELLPGAGEPTPTTGREELLPGAGESAPEMPPAEEQAAPENEVQDHIWAGLQAPEFTGILLAVVLGVALLADLAGIAVLSVKIDRAQGRLQRMAPLPNTVKGAPAQGSPGKGGCLLTTSLAAPQVGKAHNIGSRPAQQDSFGLGKAGDGMLAVVADGMGGLSGGDQVSQQIVMAMLNLAAQLPSGSAADGVLGRMVTEVNEKINRMLGAEGQYKSGSTLVSVLVEGDHFHWISVGDSRIYLYRHGAMLQLNREHTYEQELLVRAMNGELSFDEARSDPQRQRLTSFIGMGKLKYVDASLRSIRLCAGDRLLLMSDGVFNALSERQMCETLAEKSDVQLAARELEEKVLAAKLPNQDNFTVVILGF